MQAQVATKISANLIACNVLIVPSKILKKGETKLARQPQVTRTIVTSNITVLCLNLETKEPFEQTIVMPRAQKDDKKLMKKISAMIDNDKVKAVHVINITTSETLYGMSEEKFIANADILPTRN